jgi:hypothetical protein
VVDQKNPMFVVYVLFATAAAMVLFATLLWFGVVDLGIDPGPLALVLVLGAVMDVALSTLLLVRMTRR